MLAAGSPGPVAPAEYFPSVGQSQPAQGKLHRISEGDWWEGRGRDVGGGYTATS